MITHAYRLLSLAGSEVLLCLVCDRYSANPNDIREVYCGYCHVYLADIPPDYQTKKAIHSRSPNPEGAMSLTIAQLIRQLQTLPPDVLVYVHDDWYDFPLALPTAEDIVEGSPDVVAGDGLARPRRLVLSRA